MNSILFKILEIKKQLQETKADISSTLAKVEDFESEIAKIMENSSKNKLHKELTKALVNLENRKEEYLGRACYIPKDATREVKRKRWEEIRRRYRKGDKLVDLAKEFNYTERRVREIIKEEEQ